MNIENLNHTKHIYEIPPLPDNTTTKGVETHITENYLNNLNNEVGNYQLAVAPSRSRLPNFIFFRLG